MNRTFIGVFAAVAMATSVAAWAKSPRLRISLEKSTYSLREPIKLNVVFELGDGCWTVNPNATTLTFSVYVTDSTGREVEALTQDVMYELPRCNLATFCRVDSLSTRVYLCDRGPDMYAPYFKFSPGRYRVKAVYDSGFLVFAMKSDEDEYCRAMASRNDVIGRLESNVVELEVVRTSSAEPLSSPRNEPVLRKNRIRPVSGPRSRPKEVGEGS